MAEVSHSETETRKGTQGDIRIPNELEQTYIAGSDTAITTGADTSFWTDHCLPSVSSLLKSCGSYTLEQKAGHLRFIEQHVIPHIGPRPISREEYVLAHTGSPIENSINFSDSGKPKIRFVFQPKGIKGIPEAVGADISWFHQTTSVFCLSGEEKASLKAKVPQLSRIPYYLVGFDLDSEERVLKAYFSTIYKHILYGQDTDKLVYDLVESLNPLGESLMPALTILREFRASELQRPIDTIGVDCVKPELGARFKLYTRFPRHKNNFEYVRHQLTLGGRLTDGTTLEGIEILRRIWHLLLNEPEGFAESDQSKQERELEDPYFGILLSWELQPGKDSPIPKLYVPLWRFADSNQIITENYEKIFRKWGWSWGEGRKYNDAIEQVYAEDGVFDDTRIVHTYASFNFSKKKGKYMTSYSSPPSMGNFGLPLSN